MFSSTGYYSTNSHENLATNVYGGWLGQGINNSSQVVTSGRAPNNSKWVQVDLGENKPIN